MGETKKNAFKEEIKNNFERGSRGMAIFYIVIVSIVIISLIRQIFAGEYENCFTCMLTLVLFLIPVFLDRKFKIDLPNTFEAIIVLFIFSAEILGELNGFYLKISWWDTMLHGLNGFLMAAIGFSMIDILNRSERFKFNASPLFIALVAFCFSMTIGVLWEFFEFFADYFFGMDMQKDTILSTFSTVNIHPEGLNIPVVISGIEDVTVSGRNLMIDGVAANEVSLGLGGYLDIGIIDTMGDLSINFVGAVIFSAIGFFYIKNRGRGNFIKKFIPTMKKVEN